MSGMPNMPPYAAQHPYPYMPPPAYPVQGQPPYAAPAAAPPANDFAAQLLHQHKSVVKAARQIAREYPEQPAQRPGTQDVTGDMESFLAFISRLDDSALLREQQKYTEGTRHWLAIADELDARQDMAELDDGDLDESELFSFFAVKVDDGRGGWIDVAAQISFESKADLIEHLKSRFPFSCRARYSKITKAGRTLQQGQREFSIRTADEVAANVKREMARNPDAAIGMPAAPPPPPAGMSPEMQLLYKSLAEQQLEAQRANASLLQAMLTRDKPDDGKKMMETLQLAKEMFMEPMLRMVEANKPQPGDPRLSIDMAREVIQGAQTLAKANHAASGGSGGGTADMILGAVDRLAPMIFKQDQQALPAAAPGAPALPAPDLPPTQTGAIMQRAVTKKVGDALQFLLAGRLRTDQLPRYVFRPRNFTDDEVRFLLAMEAAQFENFMRSIAAAQKLPAAYMQRDDVRQGFWWVHGEVQRLALVLDWLESQGRVADRDKLLDWNAPCIIPWDPKRPILGDEAAHLFAQHYPEVVRAATAPADADLPPADIPGGPAPLRVVREPEGAPVDLFGDAGGNGQGRQPAPRRAASSDPDFV